MRTLKDLQAVLRLEIQDAKKANLVVLEAIGAATSEAAKEMIGNYQEDWVDSPYGPHGQLAPMTLDIKRRLGQGMGGNPDTPLYATGEYQKSIEFTIVSKSQVDIGSNDEKAAWLEYGTSRMVPRPIFKKAFIKVWPLIAKLIERSYLKRLRK